MLPPARISGEPAPCMPRLRRRCHQRPCRMLWTHWPGCPQCPGANCASGPQGAARRPSCRSSPAALALALATHRLAGGHHLVAKADGAGQCAARQLPLHIQLHIQAVCVVGVCVVVCVGLVSSIPAELRLGGGGRGLPTRGEGVADVQWDSRGGGRCCTCCEVSGHDGAVPRHESEPLANNVT